MFKRFIQRWRQRRKRRRICRALRILTKVYRDDKNRHLFILDDNGFLVASGNFIHN